MITLDDKQLKQYEADLKRFASRAFPFATKAMLNSAAFDARKGWQKNITDDMINRNPFTKRSIRVEQTKTLNVRRQEATVGSVAPYMETAEFGGRKRKGGKKGVPLATSFAAGQGEARPRTKLPRKANKLATIQLNRKRKKTFSRAQRNLVAVKQAAESGQKFIFMDLGKRQGIFKVTGGKRKPKVRMVHDLSEQTVTIPATPTMGPAVAMTRRRMPEMYRDALRFQLRRQGLLGQ